MATRYILEGYTHLVLLWNNIITHIDNIYRIHFLLDSSCSWNQFACSAHKCISKQWICDGEDDCGNGLDESKAICGEYYNHTM